jgi:hypothetical protein
MKAGRAYSSGIEGIPLMRAATGPQVVLARCPTAKGTSNARAIWLMALLLLNFAVQYIQGLDGAIQNGRHDSTIMSQFWPQIALAV